MNHTDTAPSRHLTLEFVLWTFLLVVALGLRLTHLAAAPLSEPEAREAMLAWRAVTGQAMPVSDYSPLLFALNGLLFALCGASDALARLWPALLGATLVLTPLLLWRRLGRIGALVTGVYFAVSPMMLVGSRQLNGAIVAAWGVMVCLGGIIRFLDTERRVWLSLAAVGLALALASDATAYGLLLTLVLAYALACYVLRFTFDVSRVALYISQVTPTFILALLAFSTGLGWNPPGLGAAGGLLVSWFARFIPASEPAISLPFLLLTYEPWALFFGVGGLIWSIVRRDRFGILLSLWTGLGLVALALMPQRTPLDGLWMVMPLAMLAGLAVEALGRGLRFRTWQVEMPGMSLSVVEGAYVLLVLVLLIYTYLVSARYAAFGLGADLMLAVFSIVMQIILLVAYAYVIDVTEALRGLAIGAGIALLAWTLSTGWGAAHVRPADPRELLQRRPTDVAVRDLVRTLRDLSWQETGLPTRLTFVYEAPVDSVMAWYLRDFDAARRVDRLEDLGAEEVSPTLVSSQRDLALRTDAEYAGQDFVLRRSWRMRQLTCDLRARPIDCRSLVRWFLFRDTHSPPESERWLTLWLRQSETVVADGGS